MAEKLPFPRDAVSQTLLRLSLLLGAGINLVLGALFMLAPELLAGWLGLELPGDPLYLWLLAICIALLGAFYGLPAYDFVAYSGNILVAIVGRFTAGGVLLAVALGRPDSGFLAAVGVLEIGLGLAHAGLWLPIRRTPLI